MSNHQIVLASASPRRLELLQQIGLNPLVEPADIDETPHPDEPAKQYVKRMAAEKCGAKVTNHSSVVIGSDTSIELDKIIIGKPVDYDDAVTILNKLSSNTHQVHTAVAVSSKGEMSSVVVSSQVRFRTISQEEITTYWRSGEPQGKAGAYAIQGLGAIFVEKITGSYSAIMGLPLFETAALLKKSGISVLGNKEIAL